MYSSTKFFDYIKNFVEQHTDVQLTMLPSVVDLSAAVLSDVVEAHGMDPDISFTCGVAPSGMDNEQLLDASCDKNDEVLLASVTGTGGAGDKQMLSVVVPGVSSVALNFNDARGLTSGTS